jgi:hypothetical protein
MCDKVRKKSLRKKSVKNYIHKNRLEVMLTWVQLVLLCIHKYIAKQQIHNEECVELFVINFIIFVLSRFGTTLLEAIHVKYEK